MAFTVPESIRSSATAGERIVFRTLKKYLPDDYIVYFEPTINGKRPDFVIIGPDLGLVVLEVKDYTKTTLLQVNHDDWMIRGTNGTQSVVKSPLKQARDYALHITDVLKKDKNLVQLEGRFAGQLSFPYGFGVVFTRLSQQDLLKNDLYTVIEPHFCFGRDEIDADNEHFSEEILIEKIMNMFTVPYRLKKPLDKQAIDCIRYHLFPEVRIGAEFREPVPYNDQLLLSLHDIKTMDLHQENLAKQIGDKNRLIRGVAGSGKTLILASRAKLLLKQHPDWNILILCYNISLASTIEQIVAAMLNEPDDLFDFFEEKKSIAAPQITVRNFHAWLKNDLRISENKIPVILEKIENKEVILPTYDAILIDEGQDFETEWLQLVSALLNPETKSLLLVEDRAQSIYKRKRSYLQDIGLSFQGRSKVLSINYRNTAQIVNFAWDFYQKHSTLKKKVVERELNGEIIAPQSTRRKGPEPAIIKKDTFLKEAQIVAMTIKKLHEEKGIPYEEMLILYRVKKFGNIYYIDVIKRELAKEDIPFYWLTESSDSKRNYDKIAQSIIISTIESSKGLDFQAVFIMNINNMPFVYEEDKEREAALLYIGMTRAKQYLCLSYSGESEYTAYLDEVNNQKSNQMVKGI